MISGDNAKELATRGGGMILDASSVSVADLKEIATRAQGGGGQVIIRSANRLAVADAMEIATRGRAHVIL
jgi:hypothetical protein